MDDNELEKEIQSKGLTAPRITPDVIDAQIVSVYYLNVAEAVEIVHGKSDDSLRVLTLCILVLRNGFTVIGESACASPENFDPEIGRKLAYENARNKIWLLEGYRLKSELSK